MIATNLHRERYQIVINGRRVLQNYTDFFQGGGLSSTEKYFLAGLLNQRASIFEWGMGSSTMIVAHLGIQRSKSVDSDSSWVERCREAIAANYTYAKHHLLQFVDIGEVGAFGTPLLDTQRELWPAYSLRVHEDPLPFDMYFVDGRFRVACVYRAFLHGKPNSLVLVHDYDRREYHVLEDVSDIISRMETIVVLRRKFEVSDHLLQLLWRDALATYSSG